MANRVSPDKNLSSTANASTSTLWLKIERKKREYMQRLTVPILNYHRLLQDIQAMLHNLISLRMNGCVYANHHCVKKILMKTDDGVWMASSRFPETVQDFVTLNGKFVNQFRV